MRASSLTLLVLAIFATPLFSQDAAPSPLQTKLIGHWTADRDNKLHTYFSQKHRLVDRDIPSDEAIFTMNDYSVYEEWAELRTIILTVSDGTLFDVMLVITLSEDGQTAVCREKSTKGWVRSFKLHRVDNKTHPAKLPERVRLTDLEKGLGSEQE